MEQPEMPDGSIGEDETEAGVGVVDERAVPPEVPGHAAPKRTAPEDGPDDLADREIGSDPPGPGPLLHD